MFYSLKWWKGKNWWKGEKWWKGENYENGEKGENDDWIYLMHTIISCYNCNMDLDNKYHNCS